MSEVHVNALAEFHGRTPITRLEQVVATLELHADASALLHGEDAPLVGMLREQVREVRAIVFALRAQGAP